MTPVTDEKLKFWVDSWKNSVDDLGQQSSSFRLLSPHLLILDLADEIANNQLSNKTARLYFQQKVDLYCSENTIIFSLMREELILLRRSFGNNHVGHMLQLCKKALKRFRQGEYFQVLTSHLFEIISTPEWGTDDDLSITQLNEQLILEFLFRGFSLKTIRSMVDNVLSTYNEMEDDGMVYGTTSYPHKLSFEEVERDAVGDQKLAWQKYNALVKSFVDDLTTEDRLQAFKAYFETAPQRQIYIFQVKGLKGKGEIRIGDVTFYSPGTKRFIAADASAFADETFGAGDDVKFLNAAVQTEFVDTEYGKLVSQDKVNEALDVLSCYLSSEAQPVVNTDSTISVQLDGRPRSSSNSVSKTADHMMYARGLTLEEEYLSNSMTGIVRGVVDQMLTKAFDERSDIEHALLRSLHWYRKGETAPKLEDQLLNYWIAIEKLMPKEQTNIYTLLKGGDATKFALARETISSIQASNLYQYGWDLFFEVRGYARTSLPTKHGWELELQLPEELKGRSGLFAEGLLSLKPFIDNLSDIRNNSDLKALNRKIDSVQRFYSNVDAMREQVDKTFQQIKDDMTLFYWHRNKIVHDAHFDNTLLPFYIPRARGYAAYLLQAVIDRYAHKMGNSVEEILLSYMADFDIIQEKLKKQVLIEVFQS